MSLVDLGKRLLEAAKQGMTEDVRTLMSNGAPFTTDWLGTSPLHYAAMNGHVSTAEVLLRAGISRDARTKVDRTPLHVASQEGHPEVVDLLIKNGADIEAKDMLKMTPLHWAVEKGHVGVIELLLGHGSDISVDNKFDKSPVDIAINNGRADVAELLQLARMPQQNIVEVTTDETLVEEVTDAEQLEIAQVVEEDVNDFTTSSHVSHHHHHHHHSKGLNQDFGSGDGVDQSSTAVLATLAALAEATGPLNASSTSSSSAAEALSWLESHGITMISGDAQTTLVDSGGQSLSLTEAGKLALDSLVKQKVITMATDGTELTDESGTPMVIRLTETGEAVAELQEQDSQILGNIKLEGESEVLTTEDGTTLPPGYVLAKTEPGDITSDYTSEQIIDNVQHHDIPVVNSEHAIVTTEGVIIQDGMSINIQSDSDSVVPQVVMASEEIQVFQDTTEENIENQDFKIKLDDIASKT